MKHSWPVTFLSKQPEFLAIYKHSRHAFAILLCALSLVMVLTMTSKADVVSVYECEGTGCLPPFTFGLPANPVSLAGTTLVGGNSSTPIPAGSSLLDNITFVDPNTGFSFNGYATVNWLSAGVSGNTTGEIDLFGTATSSGATPGYLNIQVTQALKWTSFFTNQNVVAQSDFLTGNCNSAANSAGASMLGTAGMMGYPPGNLTGTCSPGSTGFSLSNNPGSGGPGFALADFNVSATFFFPADGSAQESISIPLIGSITAQGVLTSQNPPPSVPEPSTMALLGVGLLGSLRIWHRRAAS